VVECYYIAKIFRQHNSLVIAVPQSVCIALNLKAGQHMVFTWKQYEGKFTFSKFKQEGEQNGRTQADRDK